MTDERLFDLQALLYREVPVALGSMHEGQWVEAVRLTGPYADV